MSKQYSDISAVILAGGKSRRMGAPKAFLEIEGRKMIARSLSTLKSLFREVIIVTDNKGNFTQFKGAKVVEDIVKDCGPLGGIYTGLKTAAHEKAFVVACDMPFLHPGLIRKVVAASRNNNYGCVLVRSDQGLEPLHAVYSKEILKEVERCLHKKELAVRNIFSHCKCRYISPRKNELISFANINTPADLAQSKVGAVRIAKGKEIRFVDTVVSEIILTIYLNNRRLCALLCSPHDLRELCIGFLYTQGLIQSIDDIKEIKIVPGNHNAHLKLKARKLPQISRNKPRLKIDHRDVIRLMRELEDRAATFRKTGAVHCAALAQAQKIVLFKEDIGRHNALDKVVGWALSKGLDMSSLLFLTSGRISSEIFTKVKTTGSTFLISKNAPTNQAVKLAKEAGFTLIGFVRNQRMNVYSGKERVK